MSAIRVTPSPIAAHHVDLKPCSSPLLMNERPLSRRAPNTHAFLSPKPKQTSSDLGLLRNRDDDIYSSERSFRRTKSEPHILPEKILLSENFGSSRTSSLSGNQGNQGKFETITFP